MSIKRKINKFINNLFLIGSNKIILLVILMIIANLFFDILIIKEICILLNVTSYLQVIYEIIYIISFIFLIVVIYNYEPYYKQKRKYNKKDSKK